MENLAYLICLVVESVLCLLLAGILIFYYKHPEVPFYVYITSIIIWFFTFVLVVILPYDLQFKDDYDYKFTYVIYYYYDVIYYTIFVFAWILIPLLQGYEASGDFTFKNKMIYSIKYNLYYYLALFGIGAAAVIYIYIRTSLSARQLYSLLMDLSYVPGLFLVMFFLSFSFYNLPIKLFNASNIKKNIKYLEWSEGCVDYNLNELRKALLQCGFKAQATLNQIDYTKETNEEIKKYKEKIQKYLLDIQDNRNIYKIKLSIENNKQEPVKSFKALTNLNQSIKNLKFDIIRNVKKEEVLYQKWLFLQSLDSYRMKQGMEEKLNDVSAGNLNTTANSEISIQTLPEWKITYHLKVKPILYNVLAIFLILLAGIFVVLEGLIGFKLSPIGEIFRRFDTIVEMHALAIPILIYLFFMTFYGLFHLDLLKSYNLYKNHQSDSQSILFFTSYMCKVSFALCMNFCEICGKKVKSTMKERFVNKTSVRAFDYINFFMPLSLILLILMHYKNIFNRVMSCCGFHVFSVQSDDNEELIYDGKEIFMKRNKVGEFEGLKGDKTEFGIIGNDTMNTNMAINNRKNTLDGE